MEQTGLEPYGLHLSLHDLLPDVRGVPSPIRGLLEPHPIDPFLALLVPDTAVGPPPPSATWPSSHGLGSGPLGSTFTVILTQHRALLYPTSDAPPRDE